MTELITSIEKPNVLNNIFKLSEYVIAEDRFTAAWGYVLSREPALAQAVAEILLKDRGLPAKVLQVTDHPECNSLKRPDFQIKCEGLHILVEHKLDAPLHEDQLESYIQLLGSTDYVAFIAPAFQVVPFEVLTHPKYLKPTDKDHFRWSDFYDAVKSQTSWLAQEFAEYMDSLGMAPFTLKNAEDIFDTRTRPSQFQEALKLAATEVFVGHIAGCFLKGTATGLGLEVRRPSSSITLIYIWAEQRSSYIENLNGPILALNVYERNVSGNKTLGDAKVLTSTGMSVWRHRFAKPMVQGEGQCQITYAVPLVQIIQTTLPETVKCIEEILALVHADFLEC